MVKIGQIEIEDCLREAKRPLTAKEIAEDLGLGSPTKLYPLINKLLKWKEIYSLELSAETALKKYNCKRRMCVYSYREEWLELV